MSGRTADPGLRRLVSGLLVTGYAGPDVPAWLAAELSAGLGGVAWFAHNVAGTVPPEQLAAQLRDHGDALVWCDEEGGTVTRLDHGAGSPFPGHAALGVLDEPDTTRRVALAMGARAVRSGVDVVLAPVVDVNSDPENPVIGVRSFGADPALVARHGVAFVTGVQQSGAAACAKHFPGHGATRTDSHLELPVVDDPEELLRDRDLAPFAAAVTAGVRVLMTAHVVYPAVAAEPATVSGAWLRVARSELGFDGVVATDALDMQAISRGMGRGAGAVAALRAGVDAVCIGNPVFPEPYAAEQVLEDVRRAVLAAVDTGELPVVRLEEAARRMSELATWRRTQRAPDPHGEADPVGLAEALDAAVRSLRVSGAPAGVAADRGPLVLVASRRNMAAGDSLLPAACTRHWPDARVEELHRGDGARLRALVAREPDRVPVLVVEGADRDHLVETALAIRPDVVVIDAAPPGCADHSDDAPGGGAQCHTRIRTWGGGASLVAAFDLLAGA